MTPVDFRKTALLAGIAVILMGLNLGFKLADVASSGVQIALGLIAAVFLLLAAYVAKRGTGSRPQSSPEKDD